MPGGAERRPQAQEAASKKRSAGGEIETDPTGSAEVAEALRIARSLAENGWPVFLAEPAMIAVQERKADGSPGKVRREWDPKGGHQECGYWLPKGWQQTKPEPTVVDRWKPGMALGLVTGLGVDVVDIDPRNGGELAALGDLLPTVYGEAATPSGGTHHIIASLGERKKTDYLPGVDIQAGDHDGKGRGFVFIAPTVKMSKKTGRPGVYAWTVVPEVDPFLLDLDRTGEPLAESLRSVVSRPERFEVGPEDDPTPEDRENAARIFENCVASVSSTDEGARNDTLFGQTRMLYGFALGGSLDYDDVTAKMFEAGEACGLEGDEIEGCLESASLHADGDGPSRPERAADVFEDEGPDESEGRYINGEFYPFGSTYQESPDGPKYHVGRPCQWDGCRDNALDGKLCEEHLARKKARLIEQGLEEPEGDDRRPEGMTPDGWKILKRRLAIREVDDYERSLKARAEWALVDSDEDLLEPLDPDPELIAGLVPKDGNVLLTAQFKAGKTTTTMNLAKDLLEEAPFLGQFNVAPYDGNVSVWNYEVSESMFRRWRLEAGVRSTDKHRLFVANLRGQRVDLLDDHTAEKVVERLRKTETGIWIVDPLARAASGLDENSNTDMGQWFERIDGIKAEAGVHTLLVVHHTGREGERSRGASRIDDWPDALLSLTKDKDGVRYLGAVGRDIDQEPGSLGFDPETRRLTWYGGAKRNEGQFKPKVDWQTEADVAIFTVVEDGECDSANAIYRATLALQGFECSKKRILERVRGLVEDERLVKDEAGRYRVA